MVKFDISEVYNKSGLTCISKSIQDTLYELSVQTDKYLSNVNNLRDGIKPELGTVIQNSYTKEFIRKVIFDRQKFYDNSLSRIYTDLIFQVLVASGYIPLGWLYETQEIESVEKYQVIKLLWDIILTDDNSLELIHPHIKSFGMMVLNMEGHDYGRLMYYIIPKSSYDRDFLNSWINEHHIYDIVIYSEEEYASKLVDANTSFLFKFDKITDSYNGETFRINTELKQQLPVRFMIVGVGDSCYLPEVSTGLNVLSNKYFTKEFTKGETIQFAVSIPKNHRISFVAINGILYFNDSSDLDGGGVTIIKSEPTMITSYKKYIVTISGLQDNSKIFVGSCVDMTGTKTTKKFISELNSMVSFGDEDTKIRIAFLYPMIHFNTEKVKVYAKKDNESDEELIENISVLVDNHMLVERKAVYGQTISQNRPEERIDCMDIYPGEPRLPKEHKCPVHLLYEYDMFTKNLLLRPKMPHEREGLTWKDYLPPKKIPQNVPVDYSPIGRAILFNVDECGSIIISFDGYSDYKYFRVTFDDRAMILSTKMGGRNAIDVIPVLEDYIVERPEETQSTDTENTDSGEG